MDSQPVSQVAPQTAPQTAPQVVPQAVPQAAPQAPLDFTWFPNLPLEIKCRIWELAANLERDVVITVVKSKHQIRESGNPTTYWTFHYKSKRAPPAILHASQEARREGLRYYDISFGTEFEIGTNSSLTTITNEPRIYVNFKFDRLWLDLGSDRNVKYWTHFFTFGVQRVAIYATSARMLPPPESWLQYPLKEITLYTGDTRPYFGEWQWARGTDWTMRSTNVDIPCEEKRLKPSVYKKNSSVRFINQYFDKWGKDPELMLEEKRAFVLEDLANMGATDIRIDKFVFEGKDWERPAVKLIKIKDYL